MFSVILWGGIWFVVWMYFTVFRLLVKAAWWLLSHLLTLDRHTRLPGSKPVSFYVKRALTHHRARIRERRRAKTVQEQQAGNLQAAQTIAARQIRIRAARTRNAQS